jgi:hypothetical protein
MITEIIMVMTPMTGINVMIEIFPIIKNKYAIKNNIDLISKVVLKTAMIERECFNKLIKFILDGPKYLVPLSDGIDFLSFTIFANEPEKLLQVAGSLTITLTADLGRHV